jgi:transketolase
VHGGPFGEEVARATKQALGIPESPAFLVPEAVRAYCAERAAAKREERRALDGKLAAWKSAHADRARRWEDVRARRVPADFVQRLTDGL